LIVAAQKKNHFFFVLAESFSSLVCVS